VSTAVDSETARAPFPSGVRAVRAQREAVRGSRGLGFRRALGRTWGESSYLDLAISDRVARGIGSIGTSRFSGICRCPACSVDSMETVPAEGDWQSWVETILPLPSDWGKTEEPEREGESSGQLASDTMDRRSAQSRTRREDPPSRFVPRRHPLQQP